MKFNFKALFNQAIAIAAPIVIAALARKAATGKVDIKAVAIDAAEAAIGDRLAPLQQDVDTLKGNHSDLVSSVATLQAFGRQS